MYDEKEEIKNKIYRWMNEKNIYKMDGPLNESINGRIDGQINGLVNW